MNLNRVINASVPFSVIPPDRRLRVTNVAKRLGCTARNVRYLAESGKLRGFKIGKLWFFWETDIIEYQRRPYVA